MNAMKVPSKWLHVLTIFFEIVFESDCLWVGSHRDLLQEGREIDHHLTQSSERGE